VIFPATIVNFEVFGIYDTFVNVTIVPAEGNRPAGEAWRVAKTKRHTPYLRRSPPKNVEKNHRLRLHIAHTGVDLLSLPQKSMEL
jgi:hypothetical protein